MMACCGPEFAIDHRSKRLVRVDSLITVLAVESTPHFQASIRAFKGILLYSALSLGLKLCLGIQQFWSDNGIQGN